MNKIWKVIGVDNFDRDYVGDILVKDNLSEQEANILASKMNSETTEDGLWYYKAVLSDYKLYEPEF